MLLTGYRVLVYSYSIFKKKKTTRELNHLLLPPIHIKHTHITDKCDLHANSMLKSKGICVGRRMWPSYGRCVQLVGLAIGHLEKETPVGRFTPV